MRDQAGNNLYYNTNSITLGGGESLDVILDASEPPSTPRAEVYYLYTPNLDHLSNDAENFGGLMTEVTSDLNYGAQRWEAHEASNEVRLEERLLLATLMAVLLRRTAASRRLPASRAPPSTLTPTMPTSPSPTDRTSTHGDTVVTAHRWLRAGGDHRRFCKHADSRADTDRTEGQTVTVNLTNNLPRPRATPRSCSRVSR